jgi:hypothetical protein
MKLIKSVNLNKNLLSYVYRIGISIIIPNNLHFNVINGLIYNEIMKLRFRFPNNLPAYRTNTADRYFYSFMINNKRIIVLLFNKNEEGIYKLFLLQDNNAKIIKFTYPNIRRVINNIHQTINSHI